MTVRTFNNENKGAGFYGGRPPSHKTVCPNSNNPAGHNPACPYGWKQQDEELAVVVEFPRSRHERLFDGPEAA